MPIADRAIDPRAFRRVLGHVLTGVTVVTAYADEGPVGMSCNSLTSVSLEPPLVLFCAANDGRTWPVIRHAGRFCVNVLGADQHDLCLRFARRHVERFAGVSWTGRGSGPALHGALAWIDCVIEAEHRAGDHRIVIGGVLRAEARGTSEPLAFFRGEYGTFSPTSTAQPGPRTKEIAS